MRDRRNLDTIRESFSEFSKEELPTNIPKIINSPDDLQEIYHLALGNWFDTFELEELQRELQIAIDTPLEQRDQTLATKKYLKRLRKAGLILKSAQRFSSEERNLPANFDAFLKQLGKVNDAWDFAQLHEEIKKLRIIIDSGISVGEQRTTSVEVFEDRVNFLITHIEDYINTHPLPTKNYHKLRKYVRHLMNLFQLKAALYVERHEIVQTFQYLCDLNSELGNLHDQFVEMGLTGEIDYSQSTTVIPNELKKKITQFTHALELSMQ